MGLEQLAYFNDGLKIGEKSEIKTMKDKQDPDISSWTKEEADRVKTVQDQTKEVKKVVEAAIAADLGCCVDFETGHKFNFGSCNIEYPITIEEFDVWHWCKDCPDPPRWRLA